MEEPAYVRRKWDPERRPAPRSVQGWRSFTPTQVGEFGRPPGVKMMFSRMTRSEGGITVLFPFQRISHNFLIGPDFDARKHLAANNRVRERISMLKQRVLSFVMEGDERARRKVEYYIRALDAQFEVCDRTEQVIRELDGR